jgi:hypothetical protein
LNPLDANRRIRPMRNRLVVRNGGRVGLAALVAILLLGLGLRVGEAWDGRTPVYDATAYAAIARNLDEGNGFTVGPDATQPSTNYSPGLPLLVAGIYEVSGGVHERLAREVLAVVGALAVLFAYLLGRRLGGIVSPRKGAAVVAGLVAALVVAIYPATLEYTGMLMTEPLAATLLAGAILGILWAGNPLHISGGDGADRPPSVWRWLVPGLTLGALALVRPEYLAIGAVLAVLVFLRLSLVAHRAAKDKRLLPALARAALVVLGIVVVVAPWTVRNAFALERFVPVSTGGGQVLFAGTYLPSDGNPEAVGAAVVERHPELFAPADVHRLRLEQILARLAAARYPELEADEALAKMGKEQLGNDITEHTGEYVSFVAAKVGRIWSHGPRDIMRTPVWEALHWILLGLGLLGLGVLAWLRRWEALLIAVVFLAITAISALLVASPRRVLILIPLLSACAGAGAIWAVAGARARTGRGSPGAAQSSSPGRT